MEQRDRSHLPGTAKEIAELLVDVVTHHLGRLPTAAPGSPVPPPVYGGHRVGADVTADLVYTLGQLRLAGLETIGGRSIESTITELLAGMDGSSTHTFFSYRVAETLAAHGPFEDNPLLEGCDPTQIQQVELACDSTDWLEMLDNGLPRNYAAVLARCEAARTRLGLLVDPTVLGGLLDRVDSMLSSHPLGYLDDGDSTSPARVDIYTLDVYLFCEPLAGYLGELWFNGAAHAVGLAERTTQSNGAAMAWGRSTGALAVCHTVELGALALTHGFGDADEHWLARTANAASNAGSWFSDGVINAHQHRSPYGYRGPSRRLQMTLDCLGKLAWAAARLTALDREGPDQRFVGAWNPHDCKRLNGGLGKLSAASQDEAFPHRDEWTPLSTDTPAGVWSHRSRANALTLAVVGPLHSDYLPVAANPSLYEVPVDRPLACWLPTVWQDDRAWCGAGLPASVTHSPDELRLRWDGLQPLPSTGNRSEILDGTREATYRINGRSIEIQERLSFDDPPSAVSVTVPEALGRPLRVEVDSDLEHRTLQVDTSGMKEWRSFWGELPRIHEVTFSPQREMSWTLRATPLLRVASESGHHHYHQSLYGPLAGRVLTSRFAAHHMNFQDGGASRLEHVDQYHLHWPEWFVGADLEAMERFLGLLERERVRLVWTQHNLRPHWDDPAFDELYEMVAAAADGVIHHSAWGMDLARQRYNYKPSAIHRVIPHGHFANLLDDWQNEQRAAIRAHTEQELELAPASLRLGVFGAPRREKQTIEVMEAFAETARDDVGLLVCSLSPEEEQAVPDDPRICAMPYEFVDRGTYNRRLATVDALVLPFDPNGTMLTTGLTADVVGAGLPALSSAWPYALEALGEAAICWGEDMAGFVETVEALDEDQLATAATASRALQDELSWERVAERTFEFLEDLGTARL